MNKNRKEGGPMQLLIIILLLLPGSLFAQERGGGRGAAPLPPPKNLKLLDPKTEIRFVMQSFNEALGVQCTHCHVQGDFASDENPKKEVARKMILLVRQINAQFPGTGVFPVGEQKVTCWTCHRGDPHPVSLGNKAYPPPQPK